METKRTPLDRWEESGRDIEIGLAILAEAGSKTLTPHIINRLRRESPDAYLIGKLHYALWKLKPEQTNAAAEPETSEQKPENKPKTHSIPAPPAQKKRK